MSQRNAVLLICDLHERDRAQPIGSTTDPWFRKLNEQWSIWVNGRMTEQKGGPNGDVPIKPGDVYVEFNGCPAGSFSLISCGGIIAARELANYDAFCDALEAA